MKKLIAILLMVALLASLSVCAFAATNSPSQGGDVPAAGDGTEPTEEETEEPTQEVEEIAAPDPEDVKATDEDGNEVDVVIGDEEVPEDADEETKQAVEEAKEQKQDATDSLTPENINDAIADDEEMTEKTDGKNFVATEPTLVYSPDNTYPMRVTLPVDDLDTFVTALIFANGSWEIPDAQELDEDESTDSFLIYSPSYFTVVYAGDEVAAP